MAMVIRDICPRCQSPKYKKNGHLHNGKQNHQCKDCGRQFVDGFEQYLVSDATRSLVERLLLERLALRGICRAVGVGLKWLLGFIVTCFEALPDHLNVQPVSCNQDVMIQRYRQHASFYTDQYVVYKGVIPAAQHYPIGKLARKTNHIERFNNTLRQRVSRLVRSALSFSKKLDNHIGAIKYFICHYNLTKAAV
jgi:hypothetical protein